MTGPRWKLPQRHRVLVAYYRKGHGLGETAARFGLTSAWVWHILRRDCPEGIRRRRLGPRDRAARDRKIVAYYKAAHSARKTAAQFGLSKGAINAILHRDCPGDVRSAGPNLYAVEAEYRRARAAVRARQDAEIEKIWPEKDAYR